MTEKEIIKDIEKSLQWLIRRAQEDSKVREAFEGGLIPAEEYAESKALRSWEV